MGRVFGFVHHQSTQPKWVMGWGQTHAPSLVLSHDEEVEYDVDGDADKCEDDDCLEGLGVQTTEAAKVDATEVLLQTAIDDQLVTPAMSVFGDQKRK